MLIDEQIEVLHDRVPCLLWTNSGLDAAVVSKFCLLCLGFIFWLFS